MTHHWNLIVEPSLYDATPLIRVTTHGLNCTFDEHPDVYDAGPTATINLSYCYVKDFQILEEGKSSVITLKANSGPNGAEVNVILPLGESGIYNMLSLFLQGAET